MAWKSGGVKFWTNITSAGHFDELRSISCWVTRVWGEPRPCWRTPPRSAPRPSSSSRASAPSSKWTRCLQTKNCTQSVHFPPNHLRDPQNQPSISKTQKASRMSTSAVRASTYVESLIMWQNTSPGFLHYHHCWSIFSWYHLFFKTSLGRIVIVLSVPTLLAIRSRKAGNL